MTKHFGQLGVKVRGIIWYRLSPNEQGAFAGVLRDGVPNMLRRIKDQIFRVVPRRLSQEMYGIISSTMYTNCS